MSTSHLHGEDVHRWSSCEVMIILLSLIQPHREKLLLPAVSSLTGKSGRVLREQGKQVGDLVQGIGFHLSICSWLPSTTQCEMGSLVPCGSLGQGFPSQCSDPCMESTWFLLSRLLCSPHSALGIWILCLFLVRDTRCKWSENAWSVTCAQLNQFLPMNF